MINTRNRNYRRLDVSTSLLLNQPISSCELLPRVWPNSINLKSSQSTVTHKKKKSSTISHSRSCFITNVRDWLNLLIDYPFIHVIVSTSCRIRWHTRLLVSNVNYSNASNDGLKIDDYLHLSRNWNCTVTLAMYYSSAYSYILLNYFKILN